MPLLKLPTTNYNGLHAVTLDRLQCFMWMSITQLANINVTEAGEKFRPFLETAEEKQSEVKDKVKVIKLYPFVKHHRGKFPSLFEKHILGLVTLLYGIEYLVFSKISFELKLTVVPI